MRANFFKLFIFATITCTTLAVNAQSQSCDGSLGDPVINEDFGSGQNPGAPLPAGITTLGYVTTCPNDGQYTITNNLSGSNNCHQSTWQNVVNDHTGNPKGYMMVVNASQQPSVFFTQSAPVLCPGTTYQFSAYILNLITLAASGPSFSEPDITFSVETTSGQVLATYSTGTIQPTAGPTWVQESLYFTTPNDISSVVVVMTNNAPGGNGNDLILDDITFRACGPVINSGFTTVNGITNQPLCQGDNATYTLQAQVVGNNNPSYQWQSNINNTTWADISGENSKSLNISIKNASAGIFQYRVGINNGTSTSPDCRVYSNPLTATVYANPVITGVSATQSICEGDNLQLSASGGVTYQWTGPNLPATTQNPVIIKNISLADAGKYKVIAYNQYSCPAADSTELTVYPKVTAAVAQHSVTICAGANASLSASGGTAYLWSPSTGLSDPTSANPTASPADSTLYTVTVSNSNGCSDTATVAVNVLRKAIANAGANKVIFEGQSVKLTASEKYGNVFYWTPTTGLSDPNVLNPVASPTDDITYTLHVTSTTNCGIDSSSVFVRVYKKITIPNTFSPNGDGINDYWNIDALVTYPQSILTVYNRYGAQVYRSVGYNNPWDGKSNGAPLPVGTYYYVLDLKNNTPKISGWVLIVR
jgi:gliding motility-associated-like protein